MVENCNLLSHLANIGDTRSLIIHPASTTHRQLTDTQREQAGIGAGTIRVSVGIENPNDIIADLDGALKVVSGKKNFKFGFTKTYYAVVAILILIFAAVLMTLN